MRVPYADTKVPTKSACSCGRPFTVGRPDGEQPPKHTLFALEYHCESCKARKGRRGRFFKGADTEDHARFAEARARLVGMDSPFWPVDEIPPGDETNRLLRWGYRGFRDLHNERQLLGLAMLAERISRAPADVRPALATVFSDSIRYQNMVCPYDTAALKVLDVFSVHGFPVHRVQCEAALIGIPKVGLVATGTSWPSTPPPSATAGSRFRPFAYRGASSACLCRVSESPPFPSMVTTSSTASVRRYYVAQTSQRSQYHRTPSIWF